ncbi:MAG: hypothetical protein OHK0023_00760 [Anaerolineae bacterium]
MSEQKRKRHAIPPLPPHANSVWRIWEQVRLTWALFGDNRVSLWLKTLPVLAIAYAISPLDMMPAFRFFILGILDDLAIVTLALILFNSLSPDEVVVEYLKQFRSVPTYKVRRDKDGIVIEMKSATGKYADQSEEVAEAEEISQNTEERTEDMAEGMPKQRATRR